MIKKITAFICLSLALLLSCSCVRIVHTEPTPNETSLPEGAVEVYSTYPGLRYLVPGEFDWAGRSDYDAPWNCVAVLNGRLSVYGEDLNGEYGQNIVAAGREYHCFRLRGDSTGVYLFSQSTQSESLLVNESCLGILHGSHFCIILTQSAVGGYRVNLRVLIPDYETEEHQITEPVSFQGSVELFAASWTLYYELDTPKVVYLVSELNFTELRIDTSKAPDDTLANITVIEHTLPDWWGKAAKNRDLWFTNMVLMPDGTVYIGEHYGVIGVKDGVFTYYPVDYRAAMGESGGA